MQWDQIVVIIALVWAAVLSYFSFRLSKRVAKLEKQPPQHTHKGEDFLITTEVKNK